MQRTCAIRQMVPKCALNPKAFPITIQSSLAVLLASNCLHHHVFNNGADIPYNIVFVSGGG